MTIVTTPQRVVLASNNAGKVREIAQLLAPTTLTIIPQGDLAVADAAETGLTFVENALIKARHAAMQTGLPAIADDSGLEVMALAGAPGIYSARYAGVNASDAENCTHLLTALTATPPPRRARFQCVIVYLRHAADPTPLICQGTWPGEIVLEPRGTNGFGYDPLFWVPSEQKTSAELTPELKNQLSHRGQALRQLLHHLTSTDYLW